MIDTKEEFRKNIYEYCDKNIGEKVLFTSFTNLCRITERNVSKDSTMSPRDLTDLTNNIVGELIEEGRLEEVHIPYNKILENAKGPDSFRIGYPMYEILDYKN